MAPAETRGAPDQGMAIYNYGISAFRLDRKREGLDRFAAVQQAAQFSDRGGLEVEVADHVPGRLLPEVAVHS